MPGNPPPSSRNPAKTRGGFLGITANPDVSFVIHPLAGGGFPPIWDPFLSVFPLRNRILEVPKTPKISACGGLSPLTEPFWLIF